MTSPILVAVDFTDTSRKALDAAIGLALDLGAPLVIVHAFHPPNYAPALTGPAGYELAKQYHADISRSEAIELSEKWASRAREAGIETTTIADEGPPPEFVIAQAKEHQAALIVVGTQRRGGLKQLLLGSIAQDIMRLSPLPVLVVPNRA